MQLEQAIRTVRAAYVESGKAESHFAINNGDCSDFARDVLDALGGETDTIFSVEGACFARENEDEPGTLHWDWPLLKKHWGITPPAGLTKKDMAGIDFGLHVWITDGALHFDAECPGGVGSFFELPVFRRYIVQALREKGIAAPDVETDDVKPAPRCPVPNPDTGTRASQPSHSNFHHP